jgi:hypothetical protein
VPGSAEAGNSAMGAPVALGPSLELPVLLRAVAAAGGETVSRAREGPPAALPPPALPVLAPRFRMPCAAVAGSGTGRVSASS